MRYAPSRSYVVRWTRWGRGPTRASSWKSRCSSCARVRRMSRRFILLFRSPLLLCLPPRSRLRRLLSLRRERSSVRQLLRLLKLHRRLCPLPKCLLQPPKPNLWLYPLRSRHRRRSLPRRSRRRHLWRRLRRCGTGAVCGMEKSRCGDGGQGSAFVCLFAQFQCIL